MAESVEGSEGGALKNMSLDIWLKGKSEQVPCMCPTCCHEHNRTETECFFEANITHNLGRMAAEVGIYNCVWRPDENGVTKAGQLIEPLRKGIALMESDPKRFEKLNAPNGWGLYEHFLPWLRRYLEACEQHPDASVHVWR